MKLYRHKTDGGAEYLTDKFVLCPNGDKEGVFAGANYIVRLDGEPELQINSSEIVAARRRAPDPRPRRHRALARRTDGV